VTLLSEYENHVADATEFILPNNSFYLNQLLPTLTNHMVGISTKKIESRGGWSKMPISGFPQDYLGLFNDVRFESYMAQWCVEVNITYEAEKVLLLTIENMISIIDSELQER
jgi:hypothetical protein